MNWLMRDDPYISDLFSRVFADLRLPASLLTEITEFVASGGPRSNAAYVGRRPAVIPRGGPLRNIVDLQEVEDAKDMAEKLGIVDRSKMRDRRPTIEELEKLLGYQHREKNGKGRMTPLKTPVSDIILFAIFSTRRLSEITRIEWDDIDFENKTVFTYVKT